MRFRRDLIVPCLVVVLTWTVGAVVYITEEWFPAGTVQYATQAIAIGRSKCESIDPELKDMPDTWRAQLRGDRWYVIARWRDGERPWFRSPNVGAMAQINARTGEVESCNVGVTD